MQFADFLRARAGELLAHRRAAPSRVPEEALRKVLFALAAALERPGEAYSTLGQELAHADETLTLAELAGELCELRSAVLAAWAGEYGSGVLAEAAQFDCALDQVLLDAMLAFGRKLDDAMNRALGVIGHDLRNSLGAISMSSSLLARAGNNLPEDLSRPVAGIVSTVARMKHMVNDLEDLARVRLGKHMPIVRSRVDLQPILAAAVKELQDLNSDFSILFFVDGDLNGNWDGARVGQALQNLVRHATQYGSFREPIRVSAEAVPGEVVLSVANLGLPAPVHPMHAGDPMLLQRADEPGARTGGGFRLGLYVAAAIAAAHGGTLQITGGGDGTVLALHLPRR